MSDSLDRPDDSPDDGDDDVQLPPALAELFGQLGLPGHLPPELADLVKGMGLDRMDPATLSLIGQQIKAMFDAAPEDGSIAVGTATETARRFVTQHGDPTPSGQDDTQVSEAVRVADLWLSGVTDLDASGNIHGRARSRTDWVIATMPLWAELVDPVAEAVSGTIAATLAGQLADLDSSALPEGMLPPGVDPAEALAQVTPMLQRMHGSMFTMQLGQGVGVLAGELLSGNEVDLPLVGAGEVALFPEAVRGFAEGLEIDLPQVRLYLATREAARVRLFTAVPWLEAAILAEVRNYAHGIEIDTDAIEESLRSIDPTNPEAVQEALAGRLFTPAPSAAQRAALTRLETQLALIEGWVDVVTELATGPHLPQAESLAEAVRRRRATGGPAERAFASLVGLELRPRRLRDAANLFRALQAAGGDALRDSAWSHPDLAPGSGDLDDPLGYVDLRTRPAHDDVDDELARLLDGESGDEAGPEDS